jgi:hypothetical protein
METIIILIEANVHLCAYWKSDKPIELDLLLPPGGT